MYYTNEKKESDILSKMVAKACLHNIDPLILGHVYIPFAQHLYQMCYMYYIRYLISNKLKQI